MPEIKAKAPFEETLKSFSNGKAISLPRKTAPPDITSMLAETIKGKSDGKTEKSQMFIPSAADCVS